MTDLRCADCGRAPREGWLGFALFTVTRRDGTRQVSTCCYRPGDEVQARSVTLPVQQDRPAVQRQTAGQRSLGLDGRR